MTTKPAKPDLSLRDVINTGADNPNIIHPDVLRIVTYRLGNQADFDATLNRNGGDPARATDEIAAAWTAGGRTIWNKFYSTAVPDTTIRACFLIALQQHINYRFLHCLGSYNTKSQILHAAFATGQLRHPEMWLYAVTCQEAAKLQQAHPSEPGLLVAAAKLRAVVLKYALDTLNAYFADFLADPTKEPAQ